MYKYSGKIPNIIMRTDIPKQTMKISDFELEMVRRTSIKQLLYGKQLGICNGCKQHFQYRNFEIDHIVPKSRGGYDNTENLQLLCSACNRKKSNRPMEMLLAELREQKIGCFASAY